MNDLISRQAAIDAMQDLPYGYRGMVRDIIYNLPSAKQNRIARETAGKSPEEIYDFLHWLLIDYGRQFTDSRLAVIEWLKEENNG